MSPIHSSPIHPTPVHPTPAPLPPSTQARLGAFVDLRHPHIRDIATIDATGVHFAGSTTPVPALLCLASFGYAAAAALDVFHHMGFEHRALSIDVFGVDDAHRIVLEVTAATTPMTDESGESLGHADIHDLGQLLRSLQDDSTGPNIVAAIDELCSAEPPSAELAMHHFAVAGAQATVPIVASAAAFPPTTLEHPVPADLFLEPTAVPQSGRRRPTPRRLFAALRFGLLAFGLLALGLLGFGLLAFGANQGWFGRTSDVPTCAVSDTPGCEPVATYDSGTGRMTIVSADATVYADIGQPGDSVFLAATECGTDNRVVLYRPSTHEVFLFELPPEPQRAEATFVATDIDAARRAVAC